MAVDARRNMPRLARAASSKYQEVKRQPPKVYTQKELAQIDALYVHETICGQEPRYWEEVAVGTAFKADDRAGCPYQATALAMQRVHEGDHYGT